MKRILPAEGLTIKAALMLGFGLTLGLWLFAGYYFTGRIAEVQRQAAAVSVRYMRAQESLARIRSQVLLASVHVRDGLLDPDPAEADGHRRGLSAASAAVEDALRQYAPIFETDAERQRTDELRNDTASFNATMLALLAIGGGRSVTEARTVLNQTVVPKRGSLTRMIDDAQAVNRRAFVEHQIATAQVYERMQDRTWQQLGLVLATSFGIALVSTLYSSRLESHLRHQQAKDVQNTLDLHRLSAKLISAQEEERRTIARELHDEVGQVLLAIKVELAYAQRAIATNGEPSHLLDDAHAITDGALRAVRDLSQLLHPALLDDLGLPAALDWYVQAFAKRHPIETEVRHDGMDQRLAPEVETAIYRIVQEALTNVAKHAQADTCRVRLRRLPQSVAVTIEDDGRGFDVGAQSKAAGRRGLGIVGIKERVLQLQGTFRLESALERGTTLTVELPART